MSTSDPNFVRDDYRNLLVTPAELREVSGYRQPSRIRQWLDRHRIDYFLPARGAWPRVLRSVFEKHFDQRTESTAPIEPDFSWLSRKV